MLSQNILNLVNVICSDFVKRLLRQKTKQNKKTPNDYTKNYKNKLSLFPRM